MIIAEPDPEPGKDLSSRADRDLSRRSRWAAVGLVVVLAAISTFVFWSSQATGAASDRAIEANRLADKYDAAAAALSAQQSLVLDDQTYASTQVRIPFEKQTEQFEAALNTVRADGGAVNQQAAAQMLSAHRAYIAICQRVFAVVDLESDPGIVAMDNRATFAPFEHVRDLIASRQENQRLLAAVQLTHLKTLERVNRQLTPLALVVGLVLMIILTWVTRGHRRLLGVERARARHDSRHDGLTGLPNRALLTERAEDALNAINRSGHALGLLLIDLDRFKEINDTLGHQQGDDVLVQVGRRLVTAVRARDTVARLGGDEFAVLLTDVSGVGDAEETAERLSAALEAQFTVGGVVLDVEASIGVVVSGHHGQDVATLLKNADIAMYAAKAQSSGVLVYDAAMNEHSLQRLSLLGDLRRAIDQDELQLYYQPKIDIRSGEVTGAEALVRWQHPERGLVFPDAFIPMAEHTGLIRPLTLSVLEAALLRARSWVDAGRPLRVSVNLSARNLLDERLPQQIGNLLSAHGVDASWLELEVTESALMTDPVRALTLLRELSGMGINLAIDDFGTGYTSLGLLRHMPVNELKIDKSFVLTMTEDPTNSTIVRSIVELGHSLGLEIVAEGVEDDVALSALAAIGCDTAQGYLFSRPLAEDRFDHWLQQYTSVPAL